MLQLELLRQRSRQKCVGCIFADFAAYAQIGVYCIERNPCGLEHNKKCTMAISNVRVVTTLLLILFVSCNLIYELPTISLKDEDLLLRVRELLADVQMILHMADRILSMKETLRFFEVMQQILDRHGTDKIASKHMRGLFSSLVAFRVALLVTPFYFAIHCTLHHFYSPNKMKLPHYLLAYLRTYVFMMLGPMAHFFLGMTQYALSSCLKRIRHDIERYDRGEVSAAPFSQAVGDYNDTMRLHKCVEALYARAFPIGYMFQVPNASIGAVNLIQFWLGRGKFDPISLFYMSFDVGVVGLLARGQNMADMANSTLSFLYRYPISKLTLNDAAQVEVLIKTLTCHRPIPRISHILTIRAQLLASLVGTSVTYIMVVLQFYADKST